MRPALVEHWMDFFAKALWASAYLVGLNLLTVFMFHADKQRAIRREWRIPESNLLFMALIGGTPGAKYAQRRFRHKTRKQPFAGMLDFIVFLHTGVVLTLLFPGGRDLLSKILASLT